MIKIKWFPKQNQYDHYFLLAKQEKKQLNTSFKDFISTNMDLDFLVNFPRIEEDAINITKKDEKNLEIKNSPIFCFNYQYEFYDWIFKLKQLRSDTLQLYKIQPNNYEEADDNNDSSLDNIDKGLVKYTDYIELLKLALNEQLNKAEKEINLMKILTNVNFKLVMDGSRLIFSNSTTQFCGMQTCIDSINFNCQFFKKPVHYYKSNNYNVNSIL